MLSPNRKQPNWPSDQEQPRSPLFRNEVVRSNALLARTLHNELVRSGRGRGEIIDFINCLLGLVASSPRGGGENRPALLIDPHSGLPTRQAFHQLILHEVDPETEHQVSAGLMLFEVALGSDLLLATKILRHRMRSCDVVAPLGPRLIGAIVYPRESRDLPLVVERMQGAQVENASFAVAACPLESGQDARRLWRALRRELRQRHR